MPPYRDPNRLFYDPVNPTMLTVEQMNQMSPQEIQAATDQLDQHLILVLQQIEENFAKCNQVVVESLLPAVEQHGENSMRIYESIKFWRPFFEAAASMRLNEPHADDSNSVATEEPTRNSASPDRTVSSAGDQTYSRQSDVSEDLEGTPRAKRSDLDNDLSPSSSSLPPEPQWSSEKHKEFASPFLSSNQHARQGPLANSAMKQQSTSSSHALPELQRLRLRDLPPDSPDVPEPEFETAVFGGIGGGGDFKGKGRSFDLSSDPTSPSFSLLRDPSPSPSNAGDRPTPAPQSPRNPRAGGGDKAHSKLLDNILRKNLASPAAPRAGPGSSTPGRPNAARTGSKIAFPPDLPKEWDGIANLSQTSLDAFPSPIKRRQSTSTDDSFAAHLIAPPSTLRHPSYLTSSPALPRAASSSTSTKLPQPVRASFSSPAKYTRTPAKHAARLTAQHVYDSLGLNDSPLPSPPSILRTNTKPFNMYEHTQRLSMAHQSTDSPTKERSMRPGGGGGIGKRAVEEESFASNASSSTIPNQPSFVDPDRSQTRPFDLYEYQNKQNQQLDSSRVGGDQGEDTDNIDDLLNAGKTLTFHQAQRASMLPQQGMADLGGIVDDDYDEERREGREAGREEYEEEDELSYLDPRQQEQEEGQRYAIAGGGGGDEDESFNIERGLRAGAGGVGFGKGLMDGPEDTLFGMPPAQSQSQQGQPHSQIRDERDGEGERYEDDDTFTDTQEPLGPQEQGRGAGGRGFRLHGLSDMETLHGGELLSSEPFQASPLAGRWNQQ